MRKYSLYPFSMKLGIATDLWSEVAVLVMARQEIIKILVTLKVRASSVPSIHGSCVHPCIHVVCDNRARVFELCFLHLESSLASSSQLGCDASCLDEID